MELELKFAELACCEPVGDLVTTQEESMETAIPEYCPDIARIVDTVGQLRLGEKHPAGQQLTMGGCCWRRLRPSPPGSCICG